MFASDVPAINPSEGKLFIWISLEYSVSAAEVSASLSFLNAMDAIECMEKFDGREVDVEKNVKKNGGN